MPIRILTPADYTTTAWKNGGGETTEIARAPHPTGGAEFAWRLSKAPILVDGPFSTYPGIERTTTIIEGAGLDLALEDGSHIALEPDRPRSFDGAMPAHGRLRAGRVRAFNVMTARGLWRADVQVVASPVAAAAAPVLFAHALTGRWLFDGDNAVSGAIAEGETLAAHEARELRFAPAAPGRLLLARLTAW
jgi:environmental stress-induced protein Ves